MAHRLKQAGFAFDCLERENDLGGNWNYGQESSSVYYSTHLISSKKQTEFLDYPMPEEWPEFPSHRLALDYLRSYSRDFGLLEHIEYDAGVRSAQPIGQESEGWLLELESGQRRRYQKLLIANGHNWDPAWPGWSGQGLFDGLELHSCQYKTPDLLRGKRVLVVGGGNSGCDIAVESSQHAAKTRLSLRRGYHLLPKFFHGTPIDVCGERLLRWGFPIGLRRGIAHVVNYFLQGTRSSAGLPKPDHKLFESHPVINSQLIYALRHGDLEVVPDVEQLTEQGARFTDGSEDHFDVIVYATGFRLSFPFIDKTNLNWLGDAETGRPQLHLNVFHPDRDDLFVLGMIQPDSGQWGLVDRQARLGTQYLLEAKQGSLAADRFRRQKKQPANPQPINFVDSPRHRLEVEHFSYGRRLDREGKRLGGKKNRQTAKAPTLTAG